MTNEKTALWIVASLLTGVFCAATALAQPSRPAPYQSLSAVEDMNEAQAPAIAGGYYGLAGNERRYAEPLQLSGPRTKIEKAKYAKRGHSKSAKAAKLKKAGRRSDSVKAAPRSGAKKLRTAKS